MKPPKEQTRSCYNGENKRKSFQMLKQALLQAPSLGLPDLEKPFQLFLDTKQNMAVGVLTQIMGTWYRPVACLSKQLDSVAKGWPACLKAVAGTAVLTQEANKLTFGQHL
uniref:Reverse transcriptase/retrotransposon-derived protein RNase H-like domain-containing protein n=1 Tax=Laticauda laticaudata TaxID=8630 RepID=A0A8C5S797_LATLA